MNELASLVRASVVQPQQEDYSPGAFDNPNQRRGRA